MKALLVLDDKDKLSLLKTKLSKAGFDTICYQWLMKALDNIEEIAPHLVIISAEDYPRHWKVFIQHIKAQNFEYETKVFLIAENMNSDELDKIQILGITDVLYDIENDFHKIEAEFKNNSKSELNIVEESNINVSTSTLFENQLSQEKNEIEEKTFISEDKTVLSTENKIEDVKIEQTISEKTNLTEIPEKTLDLVGFPKLEEPEENQLINTHEVSKVHEETTQNVEIKPQISQKTVQEATSVPPKRKVVTSCTFSLVNPSTGKVIMGKVRKYKYPVLLFIPNNAEEIKNLRFGQIFENCNLKQVVDNQELSSNHRCQIRGISDTSIEFCLLR